MLINREKKVAKKIISLLNKRGFIVKQHSSKTSKSIYLKIDNGLIPAIRISDHKRYNDDNCKFNMIKNYEGPRLELINGRVKKYYKYNHLTRLVTDIELERNSKILSIGYSRYRKNLKNNKTNKIEKNYFNQYTKVA